jgi:PAS domain S-box-containing protein
MTNLSLKTKVTVFIAVVVIAINLVSTFLFISAHKKHIEKEITARGITLAESLARAVGEGLASENLEFIKAVEDIVHTKDVNLAQVYTSLWLAVDAYPAAKLNDDPDPGAVKHFETSEAPFYRDLGPWFDFYSPVFYHSPHAARDARNVVIGYVRIRISTDELRQAIRHAVSTNIIASALMTLFAVLVLNAFIRKYVLKPVMSLHDSVSKHRQGEFPESVPVTSADEIGELSAEFNQMCHALKEREERLADEKERLAVTLRSIGDGVIVTDVKGTICLINRVAEQHTGWTAQESVGKQLAEVFRIINEKTRERCESPVEKVIKTGIIIGLANHTALIRKDGVEIIIEDSAAPIRDRHSEIIGVILVFRDATEKRRMEEELLKAEKLQSVGLLAGGLAHDFNNLLTAIVGNISLAKKFIESGNKAQARLTEAERASRRATELTHQLLTFAKGGAPIKRTTSIVDLIKESARFALTGTNVASDYGVSGDVWNVDIDAGQMSQVFYNLIINAVHAMPDGGTIRFTVNNVELAEQEIPTLGPGPYLKISVQDSGTGIGEEHLQRIFDPYFTTKPKGSGLGLTSVYSIIKRHEGHVIVESRPGQGTTFHIYLPASRNKAVSNNAEEVVIADGQGRILVMDDEQVIRELSGEMLHSLGYEVEFARNGMEAVEIYRKALDADTPFKAVVMDLTIPGGMGGKDAIRKLRALDPNVTAIVSSGYSNDPVMADYKRYGFKGVITKPYSIENFSKTLSEVIKQ